MFMLHSVENSKEFTNLHVGVNYKLIKRQKRWRQSCTDHVFYEIHSFWNLKAAIIPIPAWGLSLYFTTCLHLTIIVYFARFPFFFSLPQSSMGFSLVPFLHQKESPKKLFLQGNYQYKTLGAQQSADLVFFSLWRFLTFGPAPAKKSL